MTNKFFDSEQNTASSHSRLTRLQMSLIDFLNRNPWSSSDDIFNEVKKSYSSTIKRQSVFRSLRMLREKTYFVFIQRHYRSTRYKICPKNDISNVHKFFEFTEDDIVSSHKNRNSWTNII
jgi:Fe2+ or Zn2+ uptake regulation protein